MKMSLEQKRAMWVKAVLSGAGTPPQNFKDEAAVVSFVATEAGAIGYVNSESVTEAVKVLTVDGKKEF